MPTPVAKNNVRRKRTAGRGKRPVARKKVHKVAAKATTAPVKRKGLAQLLTPQSIQNSMKTVTNLRSSVKNWLQYLQQADQLLDTLFVTSNSLKESGVMAKLVKQKGKNLTTEDFTNILIALMNSPLGGSVLGAMGDKDKEDASSTQAKASDAT